MFQTLAGIIQVCIVALAGFLQVSFWLLLSFGGGVNFYQGDVLDMDLLVLNDILVVCYCNLRFLLDTIIMLLTILHPVINDRVFGQVLIWTLSRHEGFFELRLRIFTVVHVQVFFLTFGCMAVVKFFVVARFIPAHSTNIRLSLVTLGVHWQDLLVFVDVLVILIWIIVHLLAQGGCCWAFAFFDLLVELLFPFFLLPGDFLGSFAFASS